jgi:hypothetical protein
VVVDGRGRHTLTLYPTLPYPDVSRRQRFVTNGEVLIRTSSDFVGAHVGESQSKTSAILCVFLGVHVCFVLFAHIIAASSQRERCC